MIYCGGSSQAYSLNKLLRAICCVHIIYNLIKNLQRLLCCLSRLKSSDLGRMWDCTFRWWWWGCLHLACTLQVSYLTPNVSLRGWQRPSSGDATIKPVMLGVREVKRKQRVMTCTFQDWKAFQLSSYQLSALTCSPPPPKKKKTHLKNIWLRGLPKTQYTQKNLLEFQQHSFCSLKSSWE